MLPLIMATILPVLVLDIEESVESLSHLYAIGVVGAIAINIGSTAFARQIDLSRAQRIVMKEVRWLDVDGPKRSPREARRFR